MADPTIERLQIEVESSSDSAVRGLDALASTLAKLKGAAKGNLGLAPIAKQVTGLHTALSGLKPETVEMLQKLGSGLTALSGLGEIKISPSIASQVGKLGNAMSEITPFSIEKLEDTAKVLERLQALGALQLPNLSKLTKGAPAPAITPQINTPNAALADATAKANAHGAAVKKATDSSNSVGLNKTTERMTIFSRATAGADSRLSRFFSSLKRIALYRAVRSILSGISNAFREGQQNLYQYSKIMGGDFAQSMDSCATSALYLKNSIAAMASPIITALAPVLDFLIDKFVQLLNLINMFFAVISGKSTYTVAKKQAVEYAEAVGSAAGGAAKAIKDATLGIDELNIIAPLDALGGGGGGSSAPDFGSMFEEMQVPEWAITAFDTVLDVATAIGAAILAWNVSKGFLNVLNRLQGLKAGGFTFSLQFAALGVPLFLADLDEFLKYFKDFQENGATFQNVTGMLSEFAGMLGDVFLVFGKLEIAGVLKVVQGVGEIVTGISDIAKNGADIDNVTTIIRGFTSIGIGLGLFTKNMRVAGVSAALQGLNTIIREVGENWDAIRNHDWSGVEWGTVIIAAIEMFAGIAAAFGAFSKIKGLSNVGKSAEDIKKVTDATGNMSTATSGLSTKLTSFAKNLGMGILILAEVAVAAILITGAIWVLGKGLEQVGIAWEPVIANGETIATAMGIGVGILVAVGVVTALLGSVGAPLLVNMGLGTLVLAELGIAAGLFIAEIWAIGKGLDEVGKAWKPVLDNGDTISTAIVNGTALLIGIGVVTAALGVATVASAGLLPLAIGLGTALLLELAGATIAFIDSLADVADEMGNRLSPALVDFNGKLPTLSDNLSKFIGFMEEFAGHVVTYSKVNAISGLAATIDTVIGWFTTDPLDKLAKDVEKIYDQTSNLNSKLNLAVPELEEASTLLRKYKDFIKEIEQLTGGSGTVSLSNGVFVNMKDVGSNLVTGFVSGIKAKAADFTNAGGELITGFNGGLDKNASSTLAKMKEFSSLIADTFKKGSGRGIVEEFKDIANGVVAGFKDKISSTYTTAKTSITTWGSGVKTWFTDICSYATFYTIAENLITGFTNGITNTQIKSIRAIEAWADRIISTTAKKFDEHSPSRIFYQIAAFVIYGFNNAISKVGQSSLDVVGKWADSITSLSPEMVVSVDTSAMDFYDAKSFAKTFTPSVSATSNVNVTADGFEEALGAFYENYLSDMAQDVRRQADKEEVVAVNVSGRTLNDAVTTQQKANGFRFVRTPA